MKSKIVNNSDAILAVVLMLAFFVAAFVCFIAMMNVINNISEGLESSLSGTDRYLTSIARS